MLLVFSKGMWMADPGSYSGGLVVQASHLVGGIVDRLPAVLGANARWAVAIPDPNMAARACDAPPYGVMHLLVGRPSVRVVVHAYDFTQESTHDFDPGPSCWSVVVNNEARILLPDFDPEWRPLP